MSYLRADADLIRSLVPQEGRGGPENTGLYLLYAVLLRAKGRDTEARDVHDAWAAWTYQRNTEHPALVPFDDLTEEIRALDLPYVEAIHEAARRKGL